MAIRRVLSSIGNVACWQVTCVGFNKPVPFSRHPFVLTSVRPCDIRELHRSVVTMGDSFGNHAEGPFPLTETDKFVLSQTDEEYKYHDWEELREIIETNNLAVLKRKPSELRRYIKWTAEAKAQYGSMTNYLLAHRLPKAWGRPPFTPASNIPFADPSDYRVLLNDWPYGFTPGINHIVVWSRAAIPTDSEKGDMTPESRKTVGDFVKRFFVDRLGPGGEDKVMWFKNWVALQSVRSLDHIHVMVRDVEPDLLAEWTKEKDHHVYRGPH